jgi:endonuclease III
MHRPATANIKAITNKLAREYQDFAHYNKKNPLDELIFILCSVKRSEKVYLNAFKTLKRTFPKYELLADTTVQELSQVIAWGGLQNQKATVVKAIINILISKFGRPTLAPLKKMPDKECEQFLLSLPGVGKKVARCVMLYSLNRQVFPIDSHCWRIINRLGWNKNIFNNNYCSTVNMDFLQELIPPSLRYSLHVNMVSHGRKICTERYPKCNACLIKQFCLKIGA